MNEFLHDPMPVSTMKKFEEDNQLKFEDAQAKEFERKHVYEVYDKIAGEFSNSRYKAWPNVRKFVEQLPTGTILVDLGTGNGKNLNLNKNIVSIGCDTSIKLLDICRESNSECLAANVLDLPFKDESIDACIFIAVLHHLASAQRRLDALRSIVRMLKTGGQCLIYVWAFEQELRGDKSYYIKQRYDREEEATKCVQIELDSLKLVESSDHQLSTKMMPIHYNGTKFKYQDCFVPWKKKNQAIALERTDLRFYHLFKENELDDLIQKLDNVNIVESYYDNGNWAVRFRKL